MSISATFNPVYLAPDEIILSETEDILCDISWNSGGDYFKDLATPSNFSISRLLHTNYRLILLNSLKDSKSQVWSRWYSFTNIAGFYERPDSFRNFMWPYQAVVILYTNQVLILETYKDNIEERGKALSSFLLNAFLAFGKPLQSNNFRNSNIEAIQQEERRRSK